MTKTIEKKKCNKCKRIKNVSDFQKQGKYHSAKCKGCLAKIKKTKYHENHEIALEKSKVFRFNNKDKIAKYNRKHYENNKQNVRNYHNAYYKNRIKNPEFRVRRNVSRLVAHALAANNSCKCKLSVLKFLPYTMQELKDHLEKQFEPWMTWENYGLYDRAIWNDNDKSTWTWQIDHIIPQSVLPYSSMEDENFKKCWTLENVRPYSAKQNLLDGSMRIRHKQSDD